MRPLRASTAALGLAIHAGCRVIEIFLESQSLAASVGQVVLVEWATARLGVTWGSGPAKRVAKGAGIGALVAGVIVALLTASRGIVFLRTELSASVILLGVGSAVLAAWRDELLLHGVLLRALGDALPAVGRVLACGVTSAGAALGRPGASVRTVLAAGLAGAIFGALWEEDGAAFGPVAAHATFRFATTTLLSGAALADDTWAGGTHGILAGTAATAALAPIFLFVVARAARHSPKPSKAG